MSDKFKFKLNHEGVGELLKSPEMQEVLKSYADQVGARAGAGYDVYVGKTRANVSVATEEAERDNDENNTLLIALGG